MSDISSMSVPLWLIVQIVRHQHFAYRVFLYSLAGATLWFGVSVEVYWNNSCYKDLPLAHLLGLSCSVGFLGDFFHECQ